MSGEMPDGGPGDLRTYTDGSLWVRIAGALSGITALTQLSTSIVTGQQAVTATAAALNSGTATSWTNGFRLKNLSTSNASIFYGPSGVTTSTGDELAAGESVIIPVANIASVFVIAASTGSTASWTGCP
jgi:hypothetical protein